MSSVTKYALSPLATITRGGPDGQIVIHGGSGFDRQRVEIDGETGGSSALVAWILARSASATHDELIDSLVGSLELPSFAADNVVGQLIEAHVLVDATNADEWNYALRRWDAHGWDDAALFHYATFGQPFDPDTLGDGRSSAGSTDFHGPTASYTPNAARSCTPRCSSEPHWA